MTRKGGCVDPSCAFVTWREVVDPNGPEVIVAFAQVFYERVRYLVLFHAAFAVFEEPFVADPACGDHVRFVHYYDGFFSCTSKSVEGLIYLSRAPVSLAVYGVALYMFALYVVPTLVEEFEGCFGRVISDFCVSVPFGEFCLWLEL